MGPYPSYLVDGTANPFGNEIIVGGLMLLPPFFDANADAAANYGGLGAVIAHEITHLFDSIGRQFDGDSQVRDWWTPEDDAQFKAQTAKLAAQVSTYEVLPGQFVDGQLTLRETVPDLGGIAIAYDAYQNSLNSIINREKLIALGLKVFRNIEFKYLVVNASDIKSFLQRFFA
jgi:putative endopeptidase